MMNKQEVDSLIANNSIRMTNRQWLESLSDEELAKMLGCMCAHCGYHNENDDSCSASGPYCESGSLDWLRAEHKEQE